MHYTLEDLLIDVNEVIKRPDPESLRVALIRYVQECYRIIDPSDRLSAGSGYFHVKPVGNSITVPYGVRNIVEVYDGLVPLETVNKDVSMSRVQFRYDRVNNKIRLGQYNSDKLTVLATKIPTDEDGNLVIIDIIYNAVVEYCIRKYLLIELTHKKQERSTLNPYMEWKRESSRAMDSARARISEMTASDIRELLKSFR